MKKTLACLLVLVLAMGGVSALAEGEMYTFDFDDFTITVPWGIKGEIGEKEDGLPFLMLYPGYDETKSFNANVTCAWLSHVIDSSAWTEPDYSSFASAVLQSVDASMKAQGVTTDNYQILNCGKIDMNGKPAISLLYSSSIDYTPQGIAEVKTVYTQQLSVSEEGMGTYMFTVTFFDVAELDAFTPIMDSITWVK